MNRVILAYNSLSGKYSLIGASSFGCDVYSYNHHRSQWEKTTTREALDLADCTKPTAKALKTLASTIEAYYKD